MGARTKSRKRAIEALFAADVREASAAQLLGEVHALNADRQNQDEIFGYATQIVDGVLANRADIDDRIASFSQGWSLDRMPKLDRAILETACWEIFYNPEVPDAVAIDEAVELAKELSTDDSGGFINGLLSRLAKSNQAL